MVDLYGRLPVWQAMRDLGERRCGCSLISGLLMQAAKPAGPNGIRRGSPHLLGVLEGLATIQVYFPAVRPVTPSITHQPAQPFSDSNSCVVG